MDGADANPDVPQEPHQREDPASVVENTASPSNNPKTGEESSEPPVSGSSTLAATSSKRPHSPSPTPSTSHENLRKMQKTSESIVSSSTVEASQPGTAGQASGSQEARGAVNHFPKVTLAPSVNGEAVKKYCISALAGEIIGQCIAETKGGVVVEAEGAEGEESSLMDSEDEDAVAAVLGGSSEDECSYSKGYVKRQALYSCLTCQKASGEVAGICLACSYACHEDHDLVELYTKRNFRCDCGNSRFSGVACKLIPEKDAINEQNQYNQNFSNAYCVCHRPYPDPQEPANFCGVQVQCIVCEDWLHLAHVLKDISDVEEKLKVPRSLICLQCLQKHKFLGHYLLAETALDYQFEPLDPKYQIDGCALKYVEKMYPDISAIDEAAWTPIEWYENLCRCPPCQELYKKEEVEFLMDGDDSAGEYEAKGREKIQEEKGRLDNVDHTQFLMGELDRYGQIEFANRVAQMRQELKDGMQSLAREMSEKGQAEVQAADVMRLFERLQEERKKKRQDNQSPAGL
ncbi:putative E3 ubiquitin-protein ligase UBR7 [Paramacrobiotus metropolitanus]|uniref:putative E3 ubiquitin-protein ligase UBR7 n=1 Tax=Paramacrobiotus metropolitanus TaxID=2943436 RepID=UPI00244585D0|nr:putative E3 ubiquitin-protein ligase UBR7 [Paramacrobiotus metropolitanus]